ncbi:hypothetical protein QFC21_004324 [Naganishia friedmannii]|uniref:Uncharacterized protein n=1 Tax=Naganishia friedmannii TaxID=89922 RepID=A0ACC2VHW3_9TREE|nr:hypothetical protein QFC21_004324 [Naganishia friedmannii]
MARPQARQRYNSKARQSTLVGSSHKKRRKTKVVDSGEQDDGGEESEFEGIADENENVEAVQEDDQERKKQLKLENRKTMRKQLVPEEATMSSKKRKRLDTYIAKKLKQEEMQESLRIIAANALASNTTQPPSSVQGSAHKPLLSTLGIKSTKTLGQFPLNPLSAIELAERREDLTVRKAMKGVPGGSATGKKGRRARKGAYENMDNGRDEEDDGSEVEGGSGDDDTPPAVVEDERSAKKRRKAERNGIVQTVDQGGAVGDAGRGKGFTMIDTAPSARPIKSSRNAPKGPTGNRKTSPPPATAESSDFDSSDSENDTAAVNEEKVVAPSAVFEPAPQAPVQRDQPVAAPVVAAFSGIDAVGSALRRGANGEVLGPRIVERKPKIKTVRMTGQERRLLRKRQAMVDAAEEYGMDEDDVDDSEDDSEDGSDEDLEDSDDEDDSADDNSEEESETESGDEDDKSEGSASGNPNGHLSEARASKFKQWALKETGVALAPDLLALNKTMDQAVSQAGPEPVHPKAGPLGGRYSIPSTSLLSRGPAPTSDGVQVAEPSASTVRPKINRRPSVTESRQGLPVVAEEQPVMEAILLNPVVIICGETGSGKTTQVPQMLYEAGFGMAGSDNPGMIAVTQPRRVAAVSLSIRVASELNLPPNSRVVAHQIRYSSTTSKETAIKFMTDGVILRELAADFLLKRYSVVVVDEAHERGVNTDVLIGVLSRVAKLREKLWRERKDGVKPLRIVIMSATLRVSDFAANPTLFAKPPPIIEIAARQHPVTTHFNRRTPNDYVTEAYKKVVKIHARLPPGGVLVFMTGQGEISALCRKLAKRFGKKAIEERKKAKTLAFQGAADSVRDEAARAWEEGESEATSVTGKSVAVIDAALEVEDLDIGYGDDLAGDVDDGADIEATNPDPDALDSDDEDDEDVKLGIDKEESEVPLHILPLYSLLSNEQQLKVFKPPPEGSRLVIVATNVAETSLTIPGIKYVVDAGRVKERQYDANTGVQSFQVAWVSKASAAQRAGRAGRTGPGHCYRLYSSAMFENHFEAFSKPEILRMPIEGIMLTMKSMNIDAVVNFPFPTPPDRQGLRRAEALLTHLGALERATKTILVRGVEKLGTVGGKITDLGKAMSTFPVTPRFAKMLVIGQQHGCLPYIIAIVSALSVGDPFLREEALGLQPEDEAEQNRELEEEIPELSHIKSADIQAKEERKAKRRAFYKSQQRYMALGNGSSDLYKLVALLGAYDYEGSNPNFCGNNFVRAKAIKETQQLRQQITSIAAVQMPTAKLDPAAKLKPPTDTQLKVIRQILCAGFIDQVAVRKDLTMKSSAAGSRYETTKGIPYRAVGVPEDVFIHPSSSLSNAAPPDFVVFGEVVRTSKVWIRTITKINPAWLATLGKSMCTFSRPLEMPSTAAQTKSSAVATGKKAVEKTNAEIRDAYVTPHFGDLGVDLPVMKVTQRLEKGRWITDI